MAAHRTNMEAILGEQALEAALVGTTHPDTRYLELGVELSFPEPSHGGAIVPGLMAGALFASWLAARLSERLARAHRARDAVAAGW